MKIYPLPVKKNKNGELVASLSVTRQYRQIMEEVTEAHAENVGVFESNEAEELADVITCCITRIDVTNYSENLEDFYSYVGKYVALAETYYTAPKDFYVDLAALVTQAYGTAEVMAMTDFYKIRYEDDVEDRGLADIIVMCVKRLESLGYDETRRANLYAAVNAKNAARGYLED